MQQGIDANQRAMQYAGGCSALLAQLSSTRTINPTAQYICGTFEPVSGGPQIHANMSPPSYAYSGCNDCSCYYPFGFVAQGKGVGRTNNPLGMLNIPSRYGESISSRLSAINSWLSSHPFRRPRIFSFEIVPNFFSGKPIYHITFDLGNDVVKHLRSAFDNKTVTPIGVCYEYTVLRMFDPTFYRPDTDAILQDSVGEKPFFPVLDDAWVSQLIQAYHVHATSS